MEERARMSGDDGAMLRYAPPPPRRSPHSRHSSLLRWMVTWNSSSRDKHIPKKKIPEKKKWKKETKISNLIASISFVLWPVVALSLYVTSLNAMVAVVALLFPLSLITLFPLFRFLPAKFVIHRESLFGWLNGTGTFQGGRSDIANQVFRVFYLFRIFICHVAHWLLRWLFAFLGLFRFFSWRNAQTFYLTATEARYIANDHYSGVVKMTFRHCRPSILKLNNVKASVTCPA